MTTEPDLPPSSPLRRFVSREPLLVAMAVKFVVDLAAYVAKRWLDLDLPTEALVAWFMATLGVATVAARSTVWSPASVEKRARLAREEGVELAAKAVEAGGAGHAADGPHAWQDGYREALKLLPTIEEAKARARQEGHIEAVAALAENNLEVVVGPPGGRHSARPDVAAEPMIHPLWGPKRRDRPPPPDSPTRHIPEGLS